MPVLSAKKMTETYEITDIICDLCKTSCKHLIGNDTYNFNYAKITPEFGYGSSLDGDDEEPKYICETCFSNIFLNPVTPKP
jgi:hypothetical protein